VIPDTYIDYSPGGMRVKLDLFFLFLLFATTVLTHGRQDAFEDAPIESLGFEAYR
jgi:hypothetical protein